MRRTIVLALLCGLSFIFSASFAQTSPQPDYRRLMEDPHARFSDVVAAAEDYFDNHPNLVNFDQGSEFKYFCRWYYFWSTRLGADQTVDEARQIWYNQVIGAGATQTPPSPSNPHADWTQLGPFKKPLAASTDLENDARGIGVIHEIAVDTVNFGTIYAGTNSAGIFKTTNWGQNWGPILDNSAPMLGITDIAIDPSNADHLLTSTGYATDYQDYSWGIYESTDAGGTWTFTDFGLAPNNDPNRPVRPTAHELRFDPVNPNRVFAVSDNHLWLSTNGGTQWNVILDGDSTSIFPTDTLEQKWKNLELKADNPNVIFLGGALACRVTLSGNNVTALHNFTASLTPNLTDTLRNVEFAITSRTGSGDTLWAGAAYKLTNSGVTSRFFRSTNGGMQWSPATGPKGKKHGDHNYQKINIAVSSQDPRIMFTGGINLCRDLTGGGQNMTVWSTRDSNLPHYMHEDVRDLFFIQMPNGTERLMIGSDGGIYISDDYGNTLQDISGQGLCALQFYGLTDYDSKEDYLIGGTQDCSSIFFNDGDWYGTNELHCDGGRAWVDTRSIGNDPISYTSRVNSFSTVQN